MQGAVFTPFIYLAMVGIASRIGALRIAHSE
jgi:hypothetical protein